MRSQGNKMLLWGYQENIMVTLPILRETPNRDVLKWLLDNPSFVDSVAKRDAEKHPDSPYNKDLCSLCLSETSGFCYGTENHSGDVHVRSHTVRTRR